MEDLHSNRGQKTSRSLVDSESLSSVNINRNIIMGCRVCRARKVSDAFYFVLPYYAVIAIKLLTYVGQMRWPTQRMSQLRTSSTRVR